MSFRQTLWGGILTSLLMWLSAALLAGTPAHSWEKVVFHLDETANARWALMLARSYLDDSPAAKIVFVAYGPGVDFLLDDAKDKRANPYDHAVLVLVDRGVEFRVCSDTLDAREMKEKDFLDDVRFVPSGISEIARLQIKEGYAYLKP
jgi:intracellular sulfur oxidation DsrE/DsrF family protein